MDEIDLYIYVRKYCVKLFMSSISRCFIAPQNVSESSKLVMNHLGKDYRWDFLFLYNNSIEISGVTILQIIFKKSYYTIYIMACNY